MMAMSEHDHFRQTLPDEIFCVKHREVICADCKPVKHATCEDCIPVNLACQLLTDSGQVLKIISRVKQCHSHANEALEEAKTDAEYLATKEFLLLKNIRGVKHMIINHFSQLEEKLLHQVYNVNGSPINSIAMSENVLRKIRDETKTLLDVMKEKTGDGIQGSSFKTLMDCHDKSVHFTHTLSRICDAYKLDNISEGYFEPENSAEVIKENLNTLGSLSCKKYITEVPRLLKSFENTADTTAEIENEFLTAFGYESTDFEEISVSKLMGEFLVDEKYIGRWSDPSIKKSGIVSILCLDKNDMVALDRSMWSLLLVDRNGMISAKYAFKCMPWAMTRQDDNRVLVSVPGEKKLFSIALQSRELELVDEITCEVEPSGVAQGETTTYITSNPWSTMAAVHKLTNGGMVSATIKKDPFGNNLFKAPLDICVEKLSGDLIVCDAGVNSIYSFSSEMVQKYTIDISCVGPVSAMAADSNCNVYVCGRLSNVVYKIDSTNGTGRIVLNENDGLSRPQAVSSIPGEKALCVLCTNDNAFKVLKLK